MFESLETRSLFSVAIDDGVVTVVGTRNNDTIVVGRLNDQVLISVNGNEQGNFDPSDVTKIVARGLAGHDSIASWGGSRIPTELIGGKGIDVLSGGNGRDILRGGPGTDGLIGHGGRDRLFGGGGSDNLQGGSGHDILRGEDGADVLVDDDVDDLIGGPGRDQVIPIGSIS